MFIIGERRLPVLLVHHGSSRFGVRIAMLVLHRHSDGMSRVRCERYLRPPRGKAVFTYNFILVGAIYHESDESNLTQLILCGSAYCLLVFICLRCYIGDVTSCCGWLVDLMNTLH